MGHCRPASESGDRLDQRAYTDPNFYAWEVENVLKRQWLSVGHISQVPEIGDYENFDLLGEAMIMVRGKDNQVRVMSRICPHRAMDLMPRDFGHAPKGNQRSFLCPYHRWSFGLDGAMLGAPAMQQSAICNGKNIPLHIFRTEIWEGFVFLTFDPDLEPVATHYQGLRAYVDRWR
ncbi:MAG: Rieske (2Fe-2S) protein, partial [Alkalinema sp. RL_2_19]|nr:Rieske (2Fe-2S) protein [Alkalinema sp. RL_2_19]